MGIFDKDRIGKNVFCRVVAADDPNMVRVGFVRWTHATVNEVVNRLSTMNAGHVVGKWVVKDVDIEFNLDEVTAGTF